MLKRAISNQHSLVILSGACIKQATMLSTCLSRVHYHKTFNILK